MTNRNENKSGEREFTRFSGGFGANSPRDEAAQRGRRHPGVSRRPVSRSVTVIAAETKRRTEQQPRLNQRSHASKLVTAVMSFIAVVT